MKQSHYRIQRFVLLLTGLFGAALFSFVFALTFHVPEWVESAAAGFIEREVSAQVDRRIDAIQPPAGESALSRAAGALYERNTAAIEHHKEWLRSQAHVRMAAAIADVRDPGCECRARWSEWIRQGTTAHIDSLERANKRITELIHSTYASVVASLKRDIRIFSGSSATMFLLLVAAAFLKPRATMQLFVPGMLLAIATLICAGFYVFGQNWLMTIIYNDYVGLAWLVYVALVFGLLCDVVLNRARITTRILNAFFNAIGSATSALPC